MTNWLRFSLSWIPAIGIWAFLASSAFSQDYANKVTTEEWQNDWFAIIAQTHKLTQANVDAYVKANQDSRDPDVLTFIGLAEIDGTGTRKNVPLALLHLGMACDLGQMRACRTTAWRGVNSEDTPQRASAIDILVDSCNQGINLACDDLTQLYTDVARGLLNDEKALKYAHLACREISREPCANSARYIRYLAPERSGAWLQQGCEDGLINACHRYALHITDEHLDKSEYQQAAELLNYGCSAGHYYSCDSLFFS